MNNSDNSLGNKSKSTSRQIENNLISSDKKDALSEKNTSSVLRSSESEYDLPDVTSHCEVSVPSPDDAALPNASLCPAISVESKDLSSLDKSAHTEKCLSPEKRVVNDKKDDKAIGEDPINAKGKEVSNVKDKKVPSTKKTKNGEKEMRNKLLTDYFQVRRSSRKILLTVQYEKQKFVEEAILSGSEEGFEVKEFSDKGRGVITNKEIKSGDFVLEYSGELLTFSDARKRELLYATEKDIGCYMYYFKYKDKQFCVDATKENGRLGRLVNHSKKGNLKTRPFFIDEYPHLIFIATRDILPGEELLYDYGDRSKKSLESYPWLAT